MSAKDLISKWEDALTQALMPPQPQPLADSDLEAVEDTSGVRVKSALVAGNDQPSYGAMWTYCYWC